MISALQWVPRGAVKQKPQRYELSAEEARMLAEREGVDLPAPEPRDEESEEEDVETETGEASREAAIRTAAAAAASLRDQLDSDGLPMDLRMDTYDDDTAALTFANDYTGADPYLEDVDEEEDSDEEDYVARSSDAYLLAAQASDDHSVLEVYCYDEATGNLFVHHDITLPAFPLSLAWMDTVPNSADTSSVASYVAVATFHPSIEIWNLDVIDPLEPSAVLGGFVDHTGVSGGDTGAKKTGKKTKKAKAQLKSKAPALKPGSHCGAVLSVAWNRIFRQLLASGSDDNTVKLWDVHTQQCLHTYTHHSQPVNCLAWHHTEGNILASGSFDGCIVISDASKPDGSKVRIEIGAPLESLSWNPHNPAQLAASTKTGSVVCYDIRNPATPLWKIPPASDTAVASLSFSVGVRGLLAAASEDGTIRLYDVEEGPKPACVGAKDMAIGKLFTVSFYTHSPWLLAAGGDKEKVAIWEVDSLEHLTERFGSRVVSLAEVPAAFVRPRQEGQPLPAPAPAGEPATEE